MFVMIGITLLNVIMMEGIAVGMRLIKKCAQDVSVQNNLMSKRNMFGLMEIALHVDHWLFTRL